MKHGPQSPDDAFADLRRIIAKHWGFTSLRPLQEQAMQAVLDGRDSLVVMPTGGGKSLCYQAPAVLRGGITVVVSPLIALMKDQVDALRANGVAAAQIDSSLTDSDVSPTKWNSARATSACSLCRRNGSCRPTSTASCSRSAFAPSPSTRPIASATGATIFARNIANSASTSSSPGASVHAYTATATEQVRRDIIAQLDLRDPVTLVGNFDRPNLTYRVLPRHDLGKQVARYSTVTGEAGIVYCLRRRDVDDLTASLKAKGVNVVAYHAGMIGRGAPGGAGGVRPERCDVVVATVAFGMGIDRSNVRFVLHAAMPKSLEHYQQETGRAGRDGLEAECVLLHSGADYLTLKSILEKSAAEAGADLVPARCAQASRRHGPLCAGRSAGIAPWSSISARHTRPNRAAPATSAWATRRKCRTPGDGSKDLSCVARVKESFGIDHVISVLRGEESENVRRRGHDKLTTFGLLKGESKVDVRRLALPIARPKGADADGRRISAVQLNEASWEVMRGQRPVRLVRLVPHKKGEGPEKSDAAEVSWEGVDAPLFEALRELRQQSAHERGEKPYMVFGDAVLRELARVRPSTPERMRQISGVGDVKLRDFADRFLPLIADRCRERDLPMDVTIRLAAAPQTRP